IVPRVGDSLLACRELTDWVASSLGKDVPIHFTQFHPDYKMLDSATTPYSTLKAHYDIAKASGLSYVYIGNVQGNPYESTYCPVCGDAVIKRDGFYVVEWNLDSVSRCKHCRNKIPLTGGRPKEFRYEQIRALY
ncbi:MAG: AmmeMemoRadiSam system radical SAM enzyme, partial [Candidatus Micrarchaeaceae archaeon]